MGDWDCKAPDGAFFFGVDVDLLEVRLHSEHSRPRSLLEVSAMVDWLIRSIQASEAPVQAHRAVLHVLSHGTTVDDAVWVLESVSDYEDRHDMSEGYIWEGCSMALRCDLVQAAELLPETGSVMIRIASE